MDPREADILEWECWPLPWLVIALDPSHSVYCSWLMTRLWQGDFISTLRLLKQSFKLQLPCMEPGENIYSFLCIYDHIIVGMYHGQSRQPLLTHWCSHEVVKPSECAGWPFTLAWSAPTFLLLSTIVGVGLFWLLFALHCSCTSTEYWVAQDEYRARPGNKAVHIN